MERITENGFVFNVASQYSVYEIVEGTKISSRKVLKNIFEMNPDEPSYIPYEDLTEETVLGWVFESIGAEEKQQIENNVLASFEEQKEEFLNPTVSDGLPWV